MNIKREDEKIEGKKRQRLPYVIEWVCPSCGEERQTSLQDKYLSYPVWGEQYDVPLFCMECDELEPIKTAHIEPDVVVRVK